MPRDQKIGLALGILLVGAVAAFFFRHDQTQVPTLPALKTAADLDRQIATYDRSPYLQSDEPIVHPTAPPITESSVDDAFPEPQDGTGLVPDPIVGGEEYTLLEPSPTHSRPESTSPPQPTEHLVQRGETLSSIAAKYLGSANRYDELFRANADQLRDPNDVHPGMTLRLPDTGKVVGAPPRRIDNSTPAESQPSEIAAGGSQPLSSTGGGTKKFVPFSRSRLTSSELDNSALDSDPKSAAKRRLTLTPPSNGNIIR